MIKVLDYKEIVVDKKLVIHISNDLEVVLRKRRPRRGILKVVKDIFNIESWDSHYKNSAISDIHHRITFK